MARSWLPVLIWKACPLGPGDHASPPDTDANRIIGDGCLGPPPYLEVSWADQLRMTCTGRVAGPGATISKLSFQGGNIGMIAIVIGGAFLLLIIGYVVMSR